MFPFAPTGPRFNDQLYNNDPPRWRGPRNIPSGLHHDYDLWAETTWNEERRRLGLPKKNLKPKHYLRLPTAEYLTCKLSDNPLGLTGMIPREELFGPAIDDMLPPTPWAWNTVELDSDSDEDDIPDPPPIHPPQSPGVNLDDVHHITDTVPPSTEGHSSLDVDPTPGVLSTTPMGTPPPTTITAPTIFAETTSGRLGSVLQDRPAVGYISSLLACWERRQTFLSMLRLPDADRESYSSELREGVDDAEAQIDTFLTHILSSRDVKDAVKSLPERDVQSFLDVIQDVLARGSLPDANSCSKARRLMQKTAAAHAQVPSSLMISGVNDPDEHPTFAGGFGDVYRASYRGKMVALKRIRMFTTDSTTQRNRLQFCKEALVWQGLQHDYILPLLGIDCEIFSPSFCMVSPWLKNGTVLTYIRDRGRGKVDHLLLQTAEGLDYLHAMNIVHGDLRGTNILVSDQGTACLSDFGLATTISDTDSTTGGFTSSSNHGGSARWWAPELLRPEAFGCERFLRTTASDVYAYACVCVELHTEKPPFARLLEVSAMLKVIAGDRPEQPSSMSAAMWELVTAAWVADFRARPTIHHIAARLKVILDASSRSERPAPL
ncbi:kinase-like domain-containing protein [Mycena polygramma]|nr:kinase-like domain-containing protein [Mycena polygramma]